MLKYKEIIFLLIILAIATFFRLWQLDKIPPGLYPDVAIYGNDAFDTLKTKNFRVFYPENNGREGLWMWLLTFSFSVFGVSVLTIKITAAIIGILTIFGLYLLTKEIFYRFSAKESSVIALLSCFFLAISFWHTNFSRLGFRAILLPFILVFIFYFLFQGFRLKRIWNFILAGIFFGLGFYTYTSFRMAIFILPFIFIPYWFIFKKENLQKKFLLFTFCFLFFIFLIALPLGIYFLEHPQDFISRAAPVSVFSAQNPIKEFIKSLIFHLGMFNFYGDPNWRHNFSGSPMLLWPIGILFLIGIIFSLQEIFRKSNYQNKNYHFLSTFYFLISIFFIMLLPGILTREGIPHALRTIGAIPPIYIFSGFGGWKIYKWLYQNTKYKKLLLTASILFLLITFVVEFDKYFNKWGKNPEIKDAFSEGYVKMGNYLNSLSPEILKYVIVNVPGVPVPYPNGIPMPAQTIMFLENAKYGTIQSTFLLPKDLDKIKINKRKTVILLMNSDLNLTNEILKKFPEAKFEEKNGFEIIKINF